MSEMKKALTDTLTMLMEKDASIVTLGADLDRSNGLLELHEKFQGRSFDVGIAEQNMVAMAAGMAAYGLKPIVNTFSVFAARRACDQVNVSVCYANQNVKIIGTDPGITAELNGGTHMTFDDVAILRSMPGMMVVEPSDSWELTQMLPAFLAHEGPGYMRMYRKDAPDVHCEGDSFDLMKAEVLEEGSDLTIIASGIMVSEALSAAERLRHDNISAEVINLHTIKPLDAETILRSVQKTNAVVTAENHSIHGGLYAAVSEMLAEKYPVRILPVAVRDQKGEVGKLSYLKKRFGLDSDSIYTAGTQVVRMKHSAT